MPLSKFLTSLFQSYAGHFQTLFFYFAHNKLKRDEWKSLAKHWEFSEEHIEAIEMQHTGEYTVLLLPLHICRVMMILLVSTVGSGMTNLDYVWAPLSLIIGAADKWYINWLSKVILFGLLGFLLLAVMVHRLVSESSNSLSLIGEWITPVTYMWIMAFCVRVLPLYTGCEDQFIEFEYSHRRWQDFIPRT